MKVTAFHVICKIEEAALGYFAQSPVFMGREIHSSRVVDFRKGTAGVQFFMGGAADCSCLGGMEIETVQESGRKIAFQCRYSVAPSLGKGRIFFMSHVNREPLDWYPRLLEALTQEWEANAQPGAVEPVLQEGAHSPEAVDAAAG